MKRLAQLNTPYIHPFLIEILSTFIPFIFCCFRDHGVVGALSNHQRFHPIYPLYRSSLSCSPICNEEYKKDKKPCGVTADDGVRVVLAHRGAAGNAEKDDEDEVGGEEDDEGVVYKEGDCG